MGFPDSVLDALATRPEHPAVEHGDQVVTGGELLSMIGTIAAGLRSAGIGPGNGMAMDLDVSAESLAAYLAGYTLGCQVVGVHPGNSASQRQHVLSRGVDVVLAGDRVGELLRGPAADPVVVRAGPDAVARVTYTSGSTRPPEGLYADLRGAVVALGVGRRILVRGHQGAGRAHRPLPAVRHAVQRGGEGLSGVVPAVRRHRGDPATARARRGAAVS